jgi:hypothetical protein
MANYNFNEDILIGEAGEKIVIRDLESMGGLFVDDNKNKTHDLTLMMPIRGDGALVKETTYEVKTDVLCRPHSDTTNMFIEIESRNGPSGINVTKADWFVMYYKYFDELWYIKTTDLKVLIRNNNFKITEQAGDEGSNTSGVLIPRYQFKSHFKVRRIPKEWLD